MPTKNGVSVIRDLRLAKGMTQEDLAAAAQVRSTTISRIERGEVLPRLGTAIRIADALEVSVTDLFPAA